jgi:O-antigen/teichoic acid export membrane protein
MDRKSAQNSTLAGKASRALGLSLTSTLLNKVGLFGIGVMLARLLGPHAFGTYAVAYVALVALLTFNELGVSLAIVRWESDPSEIVPTVTTISLVMSIIIYAACFVGAPIYASAMGAPASTDVIRVLSIIVLTDGLTNTPVALLQRTFRQGRRTIADQINCWVGTAITVVLAWSGYGAMSLAVGRLAGCFAGTILLLAFAPEGLRLGFNPAKARALLRFGFPLAGSAVIALAVTTVDQIIVGHVLGTVALGFYVLALNLANWPIGMFSQPVSIVAPAVFSRLQHDRAAMRSSFVSSVGLLCAVALPTCLLIGGAAKPLIGLVYGVHWLPSAQPLFFLALLGGAQMFFLLSYDFLAVLAKSQFLFIVQLVWFLVLIPALVIGARARGIFGASLAEFAVAALGILPWYVGQLRKLGIRIRAIISATRLPAAGAALTGIIAFVAAKVAPSYFAACAVSGVAALIIVGVLAYSMRSAFAALRAISAESAPAESLTVDEAPSENGNIDVPDVATELAAMWGVMNAPPSPVYHDITGPIPVARDGVAKYAVPQQERALELPLYQMTVASLRWDPHQAASRRGVVDGERSVTSGGERGRLTGIGSRLPRRELMQGSSDTLAALLRLSFPVDDHLMESERSREPGDGPRPNTLDGEAAG